MSRVKTGIVTSVTPKTITVRVDSYENHPKYKKRYLVSTKFRAHDEKNEAILGDLVEISETRPMSKTKRWIFIKVTKKASLIEIDSIKDRKSEIEIKETTEKDEQ